MAKTERYRLQFSFNATDPEQVAAYQFLSRCPGRTQLLVEFLTAKGALGKGFRPSRPGAPPEAAGERAAPVEAVVDYEKLVALLGPQLAQVVRDAVNHAVAGAVEKALANVSIQPAEAESPAVSKETPQTVPEVTEDMSLALEGLKVFGL